MIERRCMNKDCREIRAEIERLRAALRVVTDYMDDLLTAGRFPDKGRSADDKDAAVGWWEDRHTAIADAMRLLRQDKTSV